MQVGYLLDLMEFADPLLIFREGSKPEEPFRFSGSRSDLFAITLHGDLRITDRVFRTFRIDGFF
ncbi:hypothetical protein A1D31_36655 [Bradyrhizobium liaoningense]|nr:hypothetical protein A1D31_36655 [Bradyrhizobium liaoningense]